MKNFRAGMMLLTVLSLTFQSRAAEAPQGQRVLTCGHSFHFFLPPVLKSVAESAGIQGHEIAGLSAIGGSPMSAHWLLPDDQNDAKTALRAGKVDVLTMSPVWLPDVGIEHFVQLALEHNPKIRITVQEFWLPNDEYDPVYPLVVKKPVDHNAVTIAELTERHAVYFQKMDDEVRRLNQKLAQPAVFVVPVGQAVLALREKVLKGEVPGIATQADLFNDKVGHPRPVIQVLEAYCHFAVIYKMSPVGLPQPGICKEAPYYQNHGLWTLPVDAPPLSRYKVNAEPLNHLLQELAWEAVTHHPLSGVRP